MFALPFLFAALTASPAPEATPSLDDRVTAAVQKSIDFAQVPGAAVAIEHDGRLVYARGFGKRNVARDLPVTPETAFEVGSATKQFTAAAILQLQEAGKLSIDKRLSAYLPSFPFANDVTLRQLLNQTSGMPDYVTDELLITPVVSSPPTLAQLEARIKGPLHFAPGTKWEYSNSNYLALGAVVAAVSHLSWETYVRTHIFARAGMTHSGFFSDEPQMSDFAQPYTHGADGKGPLRPAPPIANGWAGGAGAIVSTLADMAAWNDALAHGRIVSPGDYRLMSTPPASPAKESLPYGMGLARDGVDGHPRIWHNGGTGGSRTMDACFPNDGICVIVFENETNADPDATSTAVFEAAVPEARAAAEQAAPGEDPSITARCRTIFEQLQHDSLPASALTAQAQTHLTPALRVQIQQFLAPLGTPVHVVFKGKAEDAATTTYSYRYEFATGALNYSVSFDKASGSIATIGLRPV